MKNLNDIKISKKLPIIIVLCALIASGIIGGLSYKEAKDSLMTAQAEKLSALLEAKKGQLTDYLKGIEEDLITVAQNPFTIDAMSGFENGWAKLYSDHTNKLQKLYIENNPNPTGQKEKLDYARDGSSYSLAHKEFHPWFRSFLQARDYYDIFLLDHAGNVVYSVFKEADYATNLKNGKWKDTDLANIYKATYKSKAGEKLFFDFRKYAPSADAPASFIATKILDRAGDLHGILVFQMPISRINNVMQASAGMGESGEAYIVGKDKLMRSDSRFSKESTILSQKVDSETVQDALNGETGIDIIKDYRGIYVESAHTPFNFLGTTWALIAEIDEDEILQPVHTMRNHMLLVVLFLSALIVAGGIYASRMITAPIGLITKAMEVLSKGDTSVEVPAKDRKDEVGDMAQALQVFKENRIEADRLAEEQKKAQQAEIDRAKTVDGLTSNFESDVSELIHMLSSATTELDATAQSMASIAEETTAQSSSMSKASESTSANIQGVAGAAEELSASIRELSSQANTSSSSTKSAVEDVNKASEQVASLSEAVENIGAVIGLIQDIAEQTNLLALNATIESARAGDAGKGFAVVANEVKSLAGQTAKATEDISEQIQLVQSRTAAAVEAIKNINSKILNVDEATTSIVAAIEEQNASTEEISRNTQTSATNMAELNSNVANVNEASQNTGAAATQVLGASQQLSKQTVSLEQKVKEFLVNVKKA